MSDSPLVPVPETLEETVERWARRLRATSGRTVESILATSEILIEALEALKVHGFKARTMLAAQARLSRPMMSRLEAIGRHAPMLRLRASTLPPYVTSLYALTQMPFGPFKKAIAADLRGLSRADIARVSGMASSPTQRRKLMIIKVSGDLADETRRAILEDIHSAVTRIGEAHGIGLAVSPRPRRRRRKGPSPQARVPGASLVQSVLRRRRETSFAETPGDSS
jgi:hypothetical protein